MKKSQIGSIIAAAVLTGWLFNIFPGRFLAAKLSTWPLLNRWQILSPQAPIVINNRETVRVEGSGDVLQAAGSVKSKISTLVEISRMTGSLLAVHSAVNLTSDGSFVTAESSFHNNNAFYVVLNDGRQTRVTRTSLDPATSLVFFKADLDNVPVANLAGSKDLSAGDKVIFVQNSLQNYYNRIFAEDVNFSESDTRGVPCPSYAIEGTTTTNKKLRVLVTIFERDSTAEITTAMNLDAGKDSPACKCK